LLTRSEGKYAQAEALDSKTLEAQRRVLGPEHPSTLTSMMSLADDYRFQGKYAGSLGLPRLLSQPITGRSV
jgi:hypothetical protein